MTARARAALFAAWMVVIAPAGARAEEESASAPPASSPAEPTKVVAVDLGESAFLVHSPFPDKEATSRLVQSIGVSLLLGRGYAEDGSAAPDPGAALAPALHSPLGFSKRSGRSTLRIQLAAVASPSGGYDLFVAGTVGGERSKAQRSGFVARYFSDVLQALASTQQKANPELAGLKEPLVAFVEAQAAVRPPAGSDWLGRTLYQLSYLQSDRAMGALKALGYATVEYEVGDGESAAEKTFRVAQGSDPARLPVVVKLVDASKTSLNDPPPLPPAEAQASAGAGPSSNVNLGGVYMHGSTGGDPQQRLLILHDRRAPAALERLLNTLQELDVPARQVIIDAQIVELTGGHTTELGLQWGSDFGKGSVALGNTSDGQVTGPDPGPAGNALPVGTHAPRPLQGGYDSLAPPVSGITFRAKLRALETSGDATLLSSPSVLVLDGRQARIQVGKQVPLARVYNYGNGATQTDTSNYMPVGIVLNIKPRIAEDGKFVTMQVETIVSDTRDGSGTPPVLDNRQVQSFVRVADNTPFVIGGLMSDNRTNSNEGVPFLSRIPILGWLFGVQDRHRGMREVIIVITPHVVPAAPEAALGFVVPKASEALNTLDSKLFRNAYRLRAADLEELRYLLGNGAIQGALEARRQKAEGTPLAARLRGRVPGEEVLVHHALWQVVERLGYGGLVAPDRMQVFAQQGEEPLAPRPVAGLLQASGGNTVAVAFPAGIAGGSPFASLGARVRGLDVAPADWAATLGAENKREASGRPAARTILLTRQGAGASSFDVLRSAVVLRRVLELNPGLGSAQSVHAGVQVIFPTKEDLQARMHTVDARVAELFFEAAAPLAAFRDAFEAEVAHIDAELAAAGERSAMKEQEK